MKSRDEFNKMLKGILSESEALFGTVDELPEEEVADRLRMDGIDPEALTIRLYNSLKQIARRKRASGEEVPERIMRAIEDTRPMTEPSYSAESTRTRAAKYIKQLVGVMQPSTDLEPVFDFRNKEELSERDVRILDRHKGRLKQRAEERKS